MTNPIFVAVTYPVQQFTDSDCIFMRPQDHLLGDPEAVDVPLFTLDDEAQRHRLHGKPAQPLHGCSGQRAQARVANHAARLEAQ